MEDFFSLLFPTLHPQEAPQGCPSDPSHAVGADQEGPAGGFSRDGVSQSIPGDDPYLQWDWETGAGVGKAKSHLTLHFPTASASPSLGEGTEVLPEASTDPGVLSMSCLQEGVAQQLPEPCPPPEGREQPLL